MNVNLRIPGPTPCPEDVLEAMSLQMINHRSPQFQELMERCTDGLKTFFQTKNDLYILTTAGTGVLEAMVVNALSPGDRVLAVSIGAFGDRFAAIAETYGVNVTKLDFEWGTAADPEKVAEELKKDSYRAVFVTHNETSTGVTNDVGAIARACRQAKPDVLILVDAVSSMGSLPCPVDEWDLDAVGTGSQKGWMVPPGLAMVSVSLRAWEAWESAKIPRFYLDYGRARSFLERWQTPWTPAVSLIYALDVALKRMLAEGPEKIYERQRRLGELTRKSAKELGLKLLADEKVASNTVTAICAPEGVEGQEINKIMREEYGVVLAGGQSKLAGKIFRVGHLGWCSEEDIRATFDALRQALPKLGYSIP